MRFVQFAILLQLLVLTAGLLLNRGEGLSSGVVCAHIHYIDRKLLLTTNILSDMRFKMLFLILFSYFQAHTTSFIFVVVAFHYIEKRESAKKEKIKH